MTFDSILEKYYQKYKIHFRVQSFYKEPRQWVNYKTKEYDYYINAYKEPNHREIMPDEVVLDIDASHSLSIKEKKEETTKLMKILQEKLSSLAMGYSVWNSGGSGYHFHLFFPKLMKYPKYERDELKRMIKKHLGYGYLTGKAHVCMGGGTLIQIEGRWNRKGSRKTHVKTVGDFESNELPDAVLKKYLNEKEAMKHRKPVVFHCNDKPSCIKFFEAEDFLATNDGWNRASFILAAFYRDSGKTKEEALDLLGDWNEYVLNRRIPIKNIKSTVYSVYKSKRRMTCRYRKNLLEELGQQILCKGCRHDT